MPGSLPLAAKSEWLIGGQADVTYPDEVTQAEKQKDGSTHVTIRRSFPKGGPHTTVIAVSAASLARVSDGGNQVLELKAFKPGAKR